MQLRCTYCQTMFAIGRDEKLIAIQTMNAENLQYYHAHCPKCRRANRVERAKLERSFPNWQAELKTLADQAKDENRAVKKE
jgi:phage FluMu protein Com